MDAVPYFRQQRIVVNGVKSDRDPVSMSGVPHGTVLGPFFVLIAYVSMTSPQTFSLK